MPLNNASSASEALLWGVMATALVTAGAALVWCAVRTVVRKARGNG